jgi:hypothetical protein
MNLPIRSALAVLCGLTTLLLSTDSSAARIWTDASGRHQLEATYAGIDGDRLWLQKVDGGWVSIDLAELSTADLAEVDRLALVARRSQGRIPRATGTVSLASQVTTQDDRYRTIPPPAIDPAPRVDPSGPDSRLDNPFGTETPDAGLGAGGLAPLPDEPGEDNANDEADSEENYIYRSHSVSLHTYGEEGSLRYLSFGRNLLSRVTEVSGNNTDRFRYYKPAGIERNIERWAFSREPVYCGLYMAWTEDREGWRFRGWVQRVRAW